MQVILSPSGQTGDIGEVKESKTIISNYKVKLKDFYTKLCMCIKDTKHIEQNFLSVAWVMPKGRDLGVLRAKNLNVGICNGAPSTARSSYFIIVSYFLFFLFTELEY